LRHHLGKIISPSSASRPRRDQAAGDNIYCSPRTVNSVVTSALDRLGQQLLLLFEYLWKTNEQTGEHNATGGRTDRFGSFVSLLCFGALFLEQCNRSVRREPAQGTEPRDLGCTAPRICVMLIIQQHQSGGIARRARPEKRAPSMRPARTHRTRRMAPTSTAPA